MTAHLNPRRVGNRWVFADGRTLPVVAGGDETADALDEDAAPEGRTVEMPEDLTDRDTVDDEALEALVTALEAEMDAALDAGSTDVALFKAIADDIEAVRGEKEARADADQENEAAIAEQIARVRGEAPAEGDDDDADDDPDAETPGEGEGEGDDEQDAEPDAQVEQEREPVTAAAPRRTPRAPRASAMRRHAPAPAVPGQPSGSDTVTVSLVAAAEVPGHASGGTMTVKDIAVGMHAKARGLSNGSSRVPVAQVITNYPETLTQGGNSDSDVELLKRLTKVDSAEALIAAGGWCVPHQTLYDLFTIEGADSLFDLPTIGITRGGIEVPTFIGYNAADNALWTWTAATDNTALGTIAIANIALTSNVVTIDTATNHGLAVGDKVRVTTTTAAFVDLNGQVLTVATVPDSNTFTAPFTHANMTSGAATGTIQTVKACLRIPCPTWVDYELEAEGLCISHGNLMDRSYPELTARYVDLAMAAHQRRVAARALAKITTGTTHKDDVTATAGTSDAAGELLGHVELQAQDYRSQYGMSSSAVLETVWPLWTQGAVRTSLAKRSGVDNYLSVTDAQINGWFADRGIRPQFVRDYQELYSGTPKTAWPTSVKFLMFPAGGFFKGDGGSIDLGVVRDSRLNETNDFTAAWTEQFYLVGRRGPKGREVTVTIDTDGVTACCP